MEIKENNVYCIDAREGFKLLKNKSVDLILTDPVYSTAGMITYKILSENVNRVLKESGVLVAEVGRGYFLPNIFKIMEDSSLEFGGVLVDYLSHLRFTNKPNLKDSFFISLLYFKDRRYLFDYNCIYSVKGKNSLNKEFYHWEKDLDMYEHYIKSFTNEGDLIVDPFCGSGSVLVACKKLNRRYIGFDRLSGCVEMAKKRLI
jgi:DNA modification methylase